mmetsp:Transcript_35555/g.78915  ORF Transcript_35555/g.78915 Transcript_35555/m.78915 type:complete len:702 (+) Transcript_35555:106-2211(+)|eukprot:CAMPEP_0202903044 /NCGR_PEP_ID=MMETSP1392-20130828/20524_1 /ASSEMBLY_ACC=CAM_ASM_000868 /TAXON_ID=225041 /ORGANISM="Chlamydomonas chlamydogama, Strain SAG 11-48b" /LENGTH=701 /DNA_ID=CAMNT_0049590003 /DNA_START=73 /DNA_END=2178 /DNA_ORIENTATION=+
MAKKEAKKKGGAKPADSSKPKHSNDVNRSSKGAMGQRDAATVRRLNMYKKRAKRDKKGKIIHEDLQSKDLPSTRIVPDRRWFGNTRVIGQKQLDQFREEMSNKVNDAYTVLLREKKLPLQLLEDPEKKLGGKQARANLLTTQPFQDTFGPNRKRKRPKLAVDSLDELVNHVENKESTYDEKGPADDTFRDAARESVFEKGTSKRIWGELYKVLDSSDVIIQVLDARDPMGTRCRFLEQHIRKHLRHKHLLLLLNKCDLVPSWVTKRWLHYLSREFPTLAFHASITNPFGKGALLSLLRQLSRLRSDKQAISVGFVGYPNVGKSSVINTLRTKKVCKAAPIPGETKVWQYITLMKRIFLIDCPGVVYNKNTDSETDIVLKGVVRVENLEDATEHVEMVLKRVKPEYLRRAYKISEWADCEDFLTQLAKLSGKLLKGGDPDLNTAARMVLYDWQRGKVPFFTLPPDYQEKAPVKELGDAVAQQPAPELLELPVPAEAVTEEDALAEAGARPENAAAAARAVRDALATAAAAQSRAAIPVQQDYFMPDDERKEEVDEEEAVDPDVISSAGEDEEEEDQQEGTSGSDSAEEEEEEEAGPSRRPALKQGDKEAKKGRGTKRPAPQEESDDESDGYGAGGLSWEAVLQSIQGGDGEGDADKAESKAAPAKAKSRGKGKQKQAEEPAPAASSGKKRGKKAKSSLKTLE